jgi:hypothetical protein
MNCQLIRNWDDYPDVEITLREHSFIFIFLRCRGTMFPFNCFVLKFYWKNNWHYRCKNNLHDLAILPMILVLFGKNNDFPCQQINLIFLRAKKFWLYSSSLKVKWSVPNWNNYSSSLFCVNTTVPKSSKNILLILNEIPHSPFTWHILFRNWNEN